MRSTSRHSGHGRNRGACAAATFAAAIVAGAGSFPAARAQAPASATLTLAVDATEAPRKILHGHETLDVAPGPLTLLYPKWIPGEHGPTGPLTDLVSVRITAHDAVLPWRRDLEEMFAIHCDVPAGVNTIDIAFDFILPPTVDGFSSGASSSANLLVLSWNQVVLYPGAVKPDAIAVSPAVTLPAGWAFATALPSAATAGATTRFGTVSLTTLVDSPLIAGMHLKKIDLTPASGVRHTLNLLSDSEAALAITPAETAAYRQLVLEASTLFGAHHYDHYDFLYTLSDEVAHFGLEHHQSSDDRVGEDALTDDALRVRTAGLLPHEFVHSWNGKYRRPAGLATGDFSTPMTTDLLWVYEGLTEYLGDVLTARSGLWTADEYRQNLATVAAALDNRPGREWRSLQDTADEAQLLYNARDDWDSLRRGTDFYEEGELIWLDVDATMRQMSGGRKSLDDFCRAFHGGANSGPALRPYTFDDVVAGLNAVVPYDWAHLLRERLDSLDPHAPMAGLEKGGWHLTYGAAPTTLASAIEATRRVIDTRYSLGAIVQDDGTLQDVIPGTPDAKAGLAPGMKIIAVNGRKFDMAGLRAAIAATRTAVGADRSARVEWRCVQDVPCDVSRRRALSASRARHGEAGPPGRDSRAARPQAVAGSSRAAAAPTACPSSESAA